VRGGVLIPVLLALTVVTGLSTAVTVSR